MTSRIAATVRTMVVFLAAAFQADRKAAVGAVALDLLSNLSLLGYTFAIKLVVNAIIDRDVDRTVVAVITFVSMLCIQHVTVYGALYARSNMRERTVLLLESKLAQLAGRIPDIEHLERPRYLRQMDLLRMQHANLADVPFALTVNASIATRFVGIVILYATISPPLGLLPLALLPVILIQLGLRRHNARAQERLVEERRLASYLEGLATSGAAGKELRLFSGLGPEIIDRFTRLWAQIHRTEDQEQVRAAVLLTVGWGIFTISFLGAMIFVFRLAAAGEVTVGDVILAMTLATQLNFQVTQLVNFSSWLGDTLHAASRYMWLLDYARDAEARSTKGDGAPAPNAIRAGIALEDVSFCYPGANHPTIEKVSIRLPPRSIVGLVGDNGTGKTTLVKLLCRLYDPTGGRITIDGRDLREYPPGAWRSRISAGFQDFARLELVLREAVGVGDLASMRDSAAIESAVTRAEADDVVTSLPDGIETELGAAFGGVELSDGQWQKVAMARAAMRPNPLLLILDEPTAAMDAPSEHALFQRYAAMAHSVTSHNGGITLFVSHRFSTMRMCDAILVLKDRRIAETGTHDQLMAAGGLYAELYSLQASAYRT